MQGFHLLSLAMLAAIPSACSEEGSEFAAGGVVPSQEAAAGAAGAGGESAGGAATAVEISESNDVYSFEYAYPEEAARIPELKAVLDARMEETREDHIALAIDARADADEAGYPFNPYGSSTSWEVVADLPGWLSLSATFWEFTGGAHGNYAFGSLLWDKQAETVRLPISLFTAPEDLELAAQEEFCDLLDRQRQEKRGEPVVRDQDDWMAACIGLDSVTVILGSSNRRTFDRIGFLVPPYNAGPYAEGSYEVTLGVSEAIRAAVKPEFRSAFSVVR